MEMLLERTWVKGEKKKRAIQKEIPDSAVELEGNYMNRFRNFCLKARTRFWR